ncbi:MAG: SLC13 family permease [Sedimenticola sp.]|nr:SLC13 family permease [Sedimenticola sp.]
MKKSTLIVCLFLALANGFLLFSPPPFLTLHEGRVGALLITMITLWGSGVIAEHFTALLFFLLSMLFTLAPAEVVFSGFQTTAFWLIFSGLFIGLAITSTGLGKRVARQFTTRVGSGYGATIHSLVLLGVLFAFLMPSAMGRTVLLIPIAIAIAGQMGFQSGSRGRSGIVLALLLGSFIPAFSILTANVPNIVLAGLAESELDITLLYGSYLALHFPVLGLLKMVAIGSIITRLYRDKPATGLLPDTPHGEQGRKRDQRVLGVTLAVMVLFWMSDFLHGISPAWIALAGALLLIAPGIGVVSQKECLQKVNYNPLFFVAGILGFGSLISHSGLGQKTADALLHLVPFDPATPFANFLLLSATSMFTGLLTTLPGVPAVITPLNDQLSQLSGFSSEATLMAQVVGFSTLLLPYQAPPVIVGMQLAGERISEAIKVCLVLALVTLLFLLPLDYLWWRWLGWIG